MNLLTVTLGMIFLWPQYGFEWVSFNMVQRINANGKTTQMDSRVHFHTNGDMVTYLTVPTEMFVMNNKKGELEIYNPEQNSVYKSVNYNNSSQNNTFYYFLGEVPNMGLDQVGYTLQETRVDGNMIVEEWIPPVNMKGVDIAYVELVSDGDQTVFMGFVDDEDEYFKKLYFYDFRDLKGITFPGAITEIGYVEGDSVITKTTFHDFAYDNIRDKEILDFEVPKNATLVK